MKVAQHTSYPPIPERKPSLQKQGPPQGEKKIGEFMPNEGAEDEPEKTAT